MFDAPIFLTYLSAKLSYSCLVLNLTINYKKKKMKKILIPLLLLVFVFSLAENANAQRKKRRKKKEDKEESVRSKRSRDRNADWENYISFKDKLVYDINIGNIALSNGYFGASFKPTVAYKLHDRVQPGIGLKYFYNLYTVQGADDYNLNDFGAFAFTRFKITENLFAHLEYSVLSFDNDWFFQEERRTFNYPLFGGGYASGFGKWKSTIQLLFIASEEVRELGQYPIEFWFGFSRNF